MAFRMALACLFLSIAVPSSACLECRPQVISQVYNRDFPKYCLQMLLPLAILFGFGMGAHVGADYAWKIFRRKGDADGNPV